MSLQNGISYREIQPSERLRSIVKCYFIYESFSDVVTEDTVFPSGCMEVIFNLGNGRWQTASGNAFSTTPAIELWGQVVRPMRIRSIGKNTMLGVRFLPFAAAYLVREKIDRLNNLVVDFRDFSGDDARIVHERMLDSADWQMRLQMLEHFLLRKIPVAAGNHKKDLVGAVVDELGKDDFFQNINDVAARHGISSRYLQKLFMQQTGLTPKQYARITRFQASLKLLGKGVALTAIAYDCGYSDQSHFIRDFRSFTGITPSAYSPEQSPITFAFSGG